MRKIVMSLLILTALFLAACSETEQTVESNTNQNCDPNYAGACIPPYPPDVDCGQLLARRFTVVGVDVHGLDGDGDGIACERN